MTSQPPTSIISGVEYVVTEVSGRPPAADDDFAGEVSLRLVYDPADSAVSQDHQVSGVGLVSDDGIFFNEKSALSKDVRRWRVLRKDDGYVAKQGLF